MGFKEYKNKIVGAAKAAQDVAKNADPADMDDVVRTVNDYGDALRADKKLEDAGGAPSYRHSAKAKERYQTATSVAIMSAERNKEKGK